MVINMSKRGQPDRLLTYFKAETWPLAVVTVTGLVYNIGLAFGPVLEGKLAQCLLEIMGGRAGVPAMVRPGRKGKRLWPMTAASCSPSRQTEAVPGTGESR